MKRLFYDIETSPAIGTFWSAGYKKTISHKDIIINPGIICVCWKWEGEKKIHSLEWNNGNDYDLVKDFIDVMQSSDEIIAHNGDGFDQPWIRQRAIFHRIPMSHDLHEYDTLKMAKMRAGKGFRFQSNRLDYIARYFGVGKKIKTTFDLWYDITIPAFLPNIKPLDHRYFKALKEMVKYCKVDVKVLEDVYHVFKPYVPMKIHEGVHVGGNKWDCPKCSGGNTKVNKKVTTAAGTKMVQWYCKDCDTYSHTTSKKVHLDKLAWELDRKRLNESL
jgi:hypothetical protein